MEKRFIRILVNEKDFIRLIKGEVVEMAQNADILLCLQDIGYDRMIEIIENIKNKELC